MSTPSNIWASLTWDDLAVWAGSRSVSRGRSYQRGGQVKGLAISEDGRLLAWVSGGRRYVTSVWLTDARNRSESLESQCTCPVGASGCKHAVAVVAEYLEQVAAKSPIPVADENDRRWAELDAQFSDEDDQTEVALEDESDEVAGESVPAAGARRSRSNWDERIRKHIESKSREELVELVWSLTERFPELREEFRERLALADGDVDRLVAEARRELRQVTSESGWRNEWSDEGHTPDFSKIKHRLERMAELGHADAVVKLGGEIIERGIAMVEESHDEGETGMELTSCMPVIFNAVPQSSLPPAKKLLFVIDARLKDDYDLLGDAPDAVLGMKFAPEDWSQVADELAKRLTPKTINKDESYSVGYHRNRIGGWLAQALQNAGRGGEILALYEAEARATGSYGRLVTHLIELKRFDDAERWAREGIETTMEKFPGLASDLVKLLGELAEARRQWDIVAAHAAWKFFNSPSAESFKELMRAAAKAQCEAPVRTEALKFLETGTAPVQVDAPGKTVQGKNVGKLRTDAAWPLPVPDYLLPLMRSMRRGPEGPHYHVLIDMAIADKRHEDVLKWYDLLRARKKERGGYGGYGRDYADAVAEAVAKTHPERSLEIYRERVRENLVNASVGAYETVAAYLRKMRPIFQSLSRGKEWSQALSEIRLQHRNRPRLIEILDHVEGKTIIQTERVRR